MSENMPKNQDKEQKRRKNRIFNICLYIVAGSLMLFGVFIILKERTSLFSVNSAEQPDATFPPTALVTEEPRATETPAPTAVPTEAVIETPTPTPEPTPEPGSPPVSVSFVDYGIDVAVVPVGVDENGAMETVPSYDTAGWYMYGAAPNEVGNCIIAGHNRYQGQQGLFAILHNGLKVGDRITVKLENGDYVFYLVESVENYPLDDFPDFVMSPSEDRRLTLITCLGDYDHTIHTSRTRVVAICRPVG